MGDKLTTLPWERLVKVFEQDGFRIVREHGDHLVLVKDNVARPIIIPKYHSVPVFIIRNNMRSAGMTRDQFFQLLQKA